MPTLYLGLDDVMEDFRQSGLAVSRCSIQAPDGLYGASGAPSGTYVAVTGLQNIKCMDAPDNFGSGISATENKQVPETESIALRHVLLDNFYSQLSPATNWGNIGWQAVVDGVTYDLKGAEADSQRVMTRLCLQKVTL